MLLQRPSWAVRVTVQVVGTAVEPQQQSIHALGPFHHASEYMRHHDANHT